MGAAIQVAGMKNPYPESDLDGFNDGWIEFENGDAGSRRGEVALKFRAARPGRTRRHPGNPSGRACQPH